jgi:UDP-glucose 4-epimerase
LQNIFAYYKEINNPINTIIHFAALKSVSESIQKPELYYKTNITGTLNLLDMMKKYNCNNLIFSSSATVYGNQNYPVSEESNTGKGITNPYGRTKYIIEEVLKDYSIANKEFNIIILRYFNPVGAHPSGLIGEDPNGIPNNLCPYLLKVAEKKIEKLMIYGMDYDTEDGTCKRDFIHVVDLAKAHVAAVNNINKLPNINIYNVGTGTSVSVLEFVLEFQEVNKVNIKYDFGNRRDGDLPIVYAEVNKIKNELGWVAEKTLKDICKDSYNFVKTKSN